MVELARIERVDLREAWSNEAADFTPWLQKNIDRLGDALGMDLEVKEREASVGTFSLDLLVREGSGRPVIVENQLGTTDHSHLGQILTYAAGYNASVIVWIAKEFRDEHRAALDFLNSRTGEDTEFFGVKVELWRIEGSRAAVNFDLVVTPNEWRKQAAVTSTGGGTSERGERYRLFFQELMDALRDEHQFTRARKAQPQSWYSFSSGTRWFTYGASFTAQGRARVELYIDSGEGEPNKRAFDRLEEQKEMFESELRAEMEWERLENRRASRISVLRPGSIDDNQETRDEIRQWMIDHLLAFKRVLGPRLPELVE
jgi:hypothetical protein